MANVLLMRTSKDSKISLADQITAKVTAVAETASPEDHQKVEAMLVKAEKHSPQNPVVEMIEWTPGMAALVIHEHNRFNRMWSAEHCQALAEIMASGGWRCSSQGYSWYNTKNWADGAHRLRAQALSSTTVTMSTFFSMVQGDVGVLDCGKVRKAYDAATLAGVANAKEKAEVLTAAWAYEKAAKIHNPIPTHNVAAVAAEIKRLDPLLARAIEIGEVSSMETKDALISDSWAAKIAGVLLRHKWPENRLVERLTEIQTGDFDDEKAPLAKTRGYIEGHRPESNIVTSGQELRMIIKAMLMAEMDVTVNPRRMNEIVNAIDNPPNPEYPAGEFKTDLGVLS